MKLLKKIGAIVILAVMVVGLSGCNEMKEAENTLNSTMLALQSGDFIEAPRYIKNTKSLIFDVYKDNEDFTKAIFSKLTYKINSSEKTDDSSVKMNVEITNVNIEKILSSAIGNLFSIALSNASTSSEGQMIEEDMEEKLLELIEEGINAEGAETVTNTVDINVVKTDSGWQIDADDKVIDAVTGGFLSALDDLLNEEGLVEELVPETTTSTYSDSKDKSVVSHYCDVSGCTNEGTKQYTGILGDTEYYCTKHYQEMMDMIGNMESDVGKGPYSKHTCEECEKEGTKSIVGISGQTEYYCTEHYQEMKDMLDMLYGN